MSLKSTTDGEFVLTEQIPRAQSKAIVLKTRKGDNAGCHHKKRKVTYKLRNLPRAKTKYGHYMYNEAIFLNAGFEKHVVNASSA